MEILILFRILKLIESSKEQFFLIVYVAECVLNGLLMVPPSVLGLLWVVLGPRRLLVCS